MTWLICSIIFFFVFSKTLVKIKVGAQINVYIIKVAVLLARCPLGGGSCDKECATVEVEDQVINNKRFCQRNILNVNPYKGVLRMWLPVGLFKLPTCRPGVEGGDLQLPVQGHQGHHHLPPRRSCLGSPVLSVPLPADKPLSSRSNP